VEAVYGIPKKPLTGVNVYKKAVKQEDKSKKVAQMKAFGSKQGFKKGILLLSNYKPSDFGNAQIDLTVDGGQHLRSPGDSPPKITAKNMESIFKDPVFDHKP